MRSHWLERKKSNMAELDNKMAENSCRKWRLIDSEEVRLDWDCECFVEWVREKKNPPKYASGGLFSGTHTHELSF